MHQHDLLKRYIRLRMRQNALLIFGMAAPVSGLFLVAALCSDALPDDLLLALIPLGIAAVVWAVSLYQPFRFLRMVRRQEQLFGVTFGEKRFMPLYPRTPYHQSPDWFICMGSWALYRGYVVKVTEKRYRTVMGNDYAARIETTDGRTYRFCLGAGEVKKLRDWWKLSENAGPMA